VSEQRLLMELSWALHSYLDFSLVACAVMSVLRCARARVGEAIRGAGGAGTRRAPLRPIEGPRG